MVKNFTVNKEIINSDLWGTARLPLRLYKTRGTGESSIAPPGALTKRQRWAPDSSTWSPPSCCAQRGDFLAASATSSPPLAASGGVTRRGNGGIGATPTTQPEPKRTQACGGGRFWWVRSASRWTSPESSTTTRTADGCRRCPHRAPPCRAPFRPTTPGVRSPPAGYSN